MTSHPWRVRLTSRHATDALGQILGQTARGGEIMALSGDLGAGKTMLVRGLAVGLDIPPDEVTSPTFTMVHEYRGRLLLAHVDLYRIDYPEEIEQLGIEEYYTAQTVVAIEWAEHMTTRLPPDHLAIRLEHVSPSTRRAVITAGGPHSQAWLQAVQARYHASHQRARS